MSANENRDTNPENTPKRAIFSEIDLNAFLSSRTKEDFCKFILASGQSCATPTEYPTIKDSINILPVHSARETALSPAMACWIGALRGMKEWLQELVPEWTHPADVRFGNPVFKQWHQRLIERLPNIMSTILTLIHNHPPQDEDYDYQLLKHCDIQGRQAAARGGVAPDTSSSGTVLELCAYLHDAFGHSIRLDYGTGHESSFQIALFALFQIGAFGNPPTAPPTKQRLKAVTLGVWCAYLDVVRGLQKDYRLEPAGSHGVWGLDDYHCLPFYYGAQQMIPVPGALPSDIYKSNHDYYDSVSSVHDEDSQGNNTNNTFLYFSCIDFIRELKSRAPFHETSPMLHDISGLPSWAKVASGLFKLYQGEVLSKFPVVQHWVFGTHFPATWTPSQLHFREPPMETFRTPESGLLPPTRAPWAK